MKLVAECKPSVPPPRILVVDDEEIVLVALRDTLRQQGYEVEAAADAVRALAVLKRHPVAVVLTDQQMPALTGLEFLAQVKQIQPDATRILITAVLNLNTVIDAINKAEVFRFVLKPWQREDLLAAVQSAVQKHESVIQDRHRLAANEALARRIEELERQLRETASTPRSRPPQA